jgi:peptidoglycan hydrolase-like protein with peptidoglycan-binding domain
MAQGHLRAEHEPRRLSAAKGRGQPDLTRNRTSRRLPDEEGLGRATEFRSGRNQVRGAAADGQANVRKAQEALNQQGFDAGTPDGKLGKRTREALIAFQKQHGFKPTGKADHATLHVLLAGGAAPAGTGAPAQPNAGQASPAPANAVPANPEPAPQQGTIAPQAEPGTTTGQGSAAPQPNAPQTAPQEPVDKETLLPPDTQMPDTGASGRVPAGSPQEEYKDDLPPRDDQR